MKWFKRNLKYFILTLFISINGLIIVESSLTGGSSGSRSNFITSLLSVFLNRNTKPVDFDFIEVEAISLKDTNENIIANGSNYYIPLGVTRLIQSTVLPNNATDKSVTWTSSAPEIVSVYSGGFVEARSIGENVTIKAVSSNPSSTVSFMVTVHEKLAPPTFTASLSNTNILVGLTTKLNINLSETQEREYNPYKLNFYSSDENIATINEYGVIKGHNPGTTTIGITGHSTTYSLTVTANPTTPIYPTTINLDIDEFGYIYDKTPLNYTFDTENVTDTSVTVVSSNEAIAKIIYENNQYYIYGSKVSGTAIITVYLNTDFIISASHTITMNEIKPSSLLLTADKMETGIGQRIILTPSFSHNVNGKEDVPITNQRATFTSSDPTVARVSSSNLNGIVIGLKQGVTTITARSESDPNLFATITVKIIPTPFINDSNFENLEGFVRKFLGHFMFFFIDGLLGFATFYLFLKDKQSKKTLIYSISVGVFIAVLSEVIQHFVPGRAGRFSDVLIDMAGYLFATFVCWLTLYLITKRTSKSKEN